MLKQTASDKDLASTAYAIYKRHGEAALKIWYDNLSAEDQELYRTEMQATIAGIATAISNFVDSIKPTICEVYSLIISLMRELSQEES